MFSRALPLFISIFLGTLVVKYAETAEENYTSTKNTSVLFRIIPGVRSTSDPVRCDTPNSESGTCIAIQECKKLYEQLTFNGRNQSVQTFLQKSQCGRRGYPPYVCCPSAVVVSTPTSYSECGVTSIIETTTKVVRGLPVALGSWPWIVAIFCEDVPNKRQRFQCGGTLISSQWVVTASHCLSCPDRKMKLSYVRLGELDLNDAVDDGADPINITIKEIIPHPKYKSKPLENDIALLHLSKSVEFSDYIRPICLPAASEYKSDTYYSNVKPSIAGWGAVSYRNVSSSHLLEAILNVVNISKCIQDYVNFTNQAVIDTRVICAGTNGKDSCQGDSGGPLTFLKSDTRRYYLGGIISFGVGCANKFPGVYTKVAEFMEWISQTTKLTF